MAEQIPLVDYLVLDDGEPHLVANVCDDCDARFFDRRNACASCGGTSFTRRPVSNTGTLRSYTIVHRAGPTVEVPYVSALVDLDDGTVVNSDLVGIEPDPDVIKLGMQVRLTTYVCGTDAKGTEAVAFGYEPA